MSALHFRATLTALPVFFWSSSLRPSWRWRIWWVSHPWQPHNLKGDWKGCCTIRIDYKNPNRLLKGYSWTYKNRCLSLCNNRIRAYYFFHWSSCHTFKKSLLFEGFFSAKTSSISMKSAILWTWNLPWLSGAWWTFGLKRQSWWTFEGGRESFAGVLGLHYQRLQRNERLCNHRDSRFRNHASRTIA